MKKIFKALIALVIIVVIAVGTYFIFFRKNNNKLVYSNINTLNNEIKFNGKNVVEEINQVVLTLPDLVESKGISGLDAEMKMFNEYVIVFEAYELINEEVIDNSFLIKNANSKLVKKASKNLKQAKEVYLESYNHLKDTYFAVINGSYTNDQMKNYIQNFYKLFKNINTKLSGFYLNTALAYVHGSDDTIFTNSLYKLNVEYYAQFIDYLVNKNALSDVDNLNILQDIMIKINSDLQVEYFKNKENCDNLLNKTLKLDFEAVIGNYLTDNAQNYYNEIQDEKQKEIVKNYYNLVMEVNV